MSHLHHEIQICTQHWWLITPPDSIKERSDNFNLSLGGHCRCSLTLFPHKCCYYNSSVAQNNQEYFRRHITASRLSRHYRVNSSKSLLQQRSNVGAILRNVSAPSSHQVGDHQFFQSIWNFLVTVYRKTTMAALSFDRETVQQVHY